jgi:hypothetical protein
MPNRENAGVFRPASASDRMISQVSPGVDGRDETVSSRESLGTKLNLVLSIVEGASVWM